MICKECRNQTHRNCPGDTWCDCQHRTSTHWPSLLDEMKNLLKPSENGAKQAPIDPGAGQ